MLSLGQQAKKNGRSLAGALGFLAAFLIFFASSPTSYAADVEKGASLFKNNCSSCHNSKMEKDMTGPALYGALDRVPSREILYPWIRNSAAVLADGEPYFSALYETWNKTQMTAMEQLSDEDIDDILAFVEAYQPAEAVAGGNGGAPDISEDEALSSLMGWIRLLVLIVVVLLVGIAFQLARLRGVGFLEGLNWDKLNGVLWLLFAILGLGFAVGSSFAFKEYYLFNNSASAHGAEIDNLFWITMAVVMFVFVITNFFLFFFAFKYSREEGRVATFYPENHKLELIWTIVPAVVLTILVVFGIRTWNRVMMTDAAKDAQIIELNAQQFGWNIRYPGKDEQLGELDRHLISSDNSLGIDFATNGAQDDFLSSDLVLPLGREVVLNIRSRDVLHSAYLPHFRVKMDAVPGMPTKFKLTPTITTDSMRVLTENPEFDYELACTEVCGRGHFSMRKRVVVISADSFSTWMRSQEPYYKADMHQPTNPIGNANGIADKRSASADSK